MFRLPLRRRHESAPTEPPANELPARLPDARVYVAHGDNVWGNSITFEVAEELDPGQRISVHGWLSHAPFPRRGDVVLVEMGQGWGEFIFTRSKRASGVNDMFLGEAVGAVGYSERIPETKRCDEFIENLPVFSR